MQIFLCFFCIFQKNVVPLYSISNNRISFLEIEGYMAKSDWREEAN